IRAWISQGVPKDDASTPKLVTIEIAPKKAALRRQATRQLKALARYSDGSVRDVTSLSLFESNDKAVAEVSAEGLVKVHDLPGKLSVLVRYQGHVAVFNATIPLGAPMGPLPREKNFIDTAVLANLKELGIPPSRVCDDATFLRRVTLDIAGRLPTEAEATAFLADKSADKRDEWIDELLLRPGYADFFASQWPTLL